REIGIDHHQGGERNPNDAYDFFDVPVPALLPADGSGTKNKAISLGDVLAVVAFVGTSAAEPDRTNANGATYGSDVNNNGIQDGAEYDRTASVIPAQSWHSRAPNGSVTLQDALVALNQVGDNCN